MRAEIFKPAPTLTAREALQEWADAPQDRAISVIKEIDFDRTYCNQSAAKDISFAKVEVGSAISSGGPLCVSDLHFR